MFKQQSRVIWSHISKHGELVPLLIPQISPQYEIDSFILLGHYLEQNKDLNAIVNRKYFVNKTAIVVAPFEHAFRFRSVIFFKTHTIESEKRKCWIVLILLEHLRLQNEIWQWIILHLTRIINIKRKFLQKEIFKIQTTITKHQTNTRDHLSWLSCVVPSVSSFRRR